jgi:hypothetical protein
VEVRYRRADWDSEGKTLEAYFLLHARDGSTREADFPTGFQNIDLLWSPGSKAFFVNGGNGGGYWGFWVYVYRIEDSNLRPIDTTAEARRDMVETFPPCRASGLNRQTCLSLEKNPDFNMSGIDWSSDSSNIIVMAEVPCSGGFGGIMCQVMGYELNIPAGKIVRRMKASEFARNWRKSMAWRFRTPGPPEYCEKGNPSNIPGCMGHDW